MKPIVTVGAILTKQDQILLVKRNTGLFKDTWVVPGGVIDFGETAENAIIREVKEETGLDAKLEFLTWQEEIFPDLNWHAVVLFFKGEAKGDPSFDPAEIQKLKWFKKQEVGNLKFGFNHKEVIMKFFSDEKQT